VDAAILYKDIMTPLVPMGVDVNIKSGIGPVISNPIRSKDDVEKLGYNPTVKIRLNTDKLESLGWQAHTDLETMFLRLIESMAADRKE